MLDVSHETEREQSQRTCVGCRKTDARDALLRVVFGGEPERLVPDIGRRLPGRGASVHPNLACLRAAVTRGGFARAFGRGIDADAGALVAVIVEQYRRRADGLLLAALRAKKLVVGTDAVRASLGQATEAERPRLLVVARDAVGRREELERAVARLGGACVVFGDKTSLGRLLGREELGVLAVTDGGVAAEVARAVACVNELSEDE